MKLTPEQQARIGKCVDKLLEAGTDMTKEMMYGVCTLQEKAGKLDDTGHVIGAKEMSDELDLSFAVSSEFIELPGEVEVFRSGKWVDGHGTYFDATPDYVEKIFNNTKELGFIQPLKLNHSDQAQFLESMRAQTGISLPSGGLPAIGYNPVTRTQKNQDGSLSVFGKLTNIPKHLSEIIKNLYRNRSAEIIMAQDGKGGKKEVFSGVSFLGMTRPIITQLAASFGQMFKGENPSMVYSKIDGEIKSFNFSDAAPEGVGDDKQAASQDDGSSAVTTNPNAKEAKVEFCKLTMPDGSVRTFATESEFKTFHQSQIDAAKSGTVPKAQFDALQAQVETNAQAAYFSEIDNDLKSLSVPNDQKKALPPFVVQKLTPILKSIPRALQFSENGKDQSPAKAIVALFAEVGRVGLVDFAEQAIVDGKRQEPKTDAEKAFSESVEAGIFEEKDRAAFIEIFNSKKGA